jgi:hypothetical protein
MCASPPRRRANNSFRITLSLFMDTSLHVPIKSTAAQKL